MSYIQCIVTSIKVIFTSDGRVMNQNGDIINEEYKKIIRLNKNVAIGFAEVREFCEAMFRDYWNMVQSVW